MGHISSVIAVLCVNLFGPHISLGEIRIRGPWGNTSFSGLQQHSVLSNKLGPHLKHHDEGKKIFVHFIAMSRHDAILSCEHYGWARLAEFRTEEEFNLIMHTIRWLDQPDLPPVPFWIGAECSNLEKTWTWASTGPLSPDPVVNRVVKESYFRNASHVDCSQGTNLVLSVKSKYNWGLEKKDPTEEFFFFCER